MIRLKLTILLLLFSVALSAQEKETDLGSIFSAELQKRMWGRFDFSVEQEIRLITNNNRGFDRWISTVGVNYRIIGGRLTTGINYSYFRMYNSNFYYENRHRYYVSLRYRESFGRYTVTWRGRLQGTARDENRGEYRVNPRYVLRNRLEVRYSIPGSSFTPYFSTEITNSLNESRGNELQRIRFQGGTNWRLQRATSLDIFIRWNENLIMPDPRVIALGIGYRRNL